MTPTVPGERGNVQPNNPNLTDMESHKCVFFELLRCQKTVLTDYFYAGLYRAVKCSSSKVHALWQTVWHQCRAKRAHSSDVLPRISCTISRVLSLCACEPSIRIIRAAVMLAGPDVSAALRADLMLFTAAKPSEKDRWAELYRLCWNTERTVCHLCCTG